MKHYKLEIGLAVCKQRGNEVDFLESFKPLCTNIIDEIELGKRMNFIFRGTWKIQSIHYWLSKDKEVKVFFVKRGDSIGYKLSEVPEQETVTEIFIEQSNEPIVVNFSDLQGQLPKITFVNSTEDMPEDGRTIDINHPIAKEAINKFEHVVFRWPPQSAAAIVKLENNEVKEVQLRTKMNPNIIFGGTGYDNLNPRQVP